MSTIEKPRSNKAKNFNFSGTQDHGTRGTNRDKFVAPKPSEFDSPIDRKAITNLLRATHGMDLLWEQKEDNKERRAKSRLADIAANESIEDAYSDMTLDELEAEADRILAEADAGAKNTSSQVNIEAQPQTVPTIIETGSKMPTEIRKSMARAATLDTFADDDFGDYNGDSHIRISNDHPYIKGRRK